MTAKEYLRQLKQIDNMINARMLERERLMTYATRMTPTMSHTKGAGGEAADRVSDTVEKMIELSSKIDSEIDRLVDLKNEARELIKQMQNENQKIVLSMYYLSNLTLEQVAENMGISCRWARILHGWALKEFEKILPTSC